MCTEGALFFLASSITLSPGDRKPPVGRGICLYGSGTAVSSLSSLSMLSGCFPLFCVLVQLLAVTLCLTAGVICMVSTLCPVLNPTEQSAWARFSLRCRVAPLRQGMNKSQSLNSSSGGASVYLVVVSVPVVLTVTVPTTHRDVVFVLSPNYNFKA